MAGNALVGSAASREPTGSSIIAGLLSPDSTPPTLGNGDHRRGRMGIAPDGRELAATNHGLNAPAGALGRSAPQHRSRWRLQMKQLVVRCVAIASPFVVFLAAAAPRLRF